MVEPDASGEEREPEVDPEQEAMLAERLLAAAESLTFEFPGLSSSEAERLIVDSARDFLSAAKVVQFVPTFAMRKARQLLRDGRAGAAPAPEVIPTAPPPPDIEVMVDDELIGVRAPDLATVASRSVSSATLDTKASVSAPPRPTTFYATEAKRLLEKAQALRASTLRIPVPTEEWE
jgi:hypothetical protein